VSNIEEIRPDRLTHLDQDGRPQMVDVGGKTPSCRTAEAEGWILLNEAVCALLAGKGISKKGDVLRIAETAGIMAVKKTPDLIPLCHGIRIDSAQVECEFFPVLRKIRVRCRVKALDVTGVEMEALTGVSVAALTIYDMCKAVSKEMIIEGIRLLSKTGGKSGDFISSTGSKEEGGSRA